MRHRESGGTLQHQFHVRTGDKPSVHRDRRRQCQFRPPGMWEQRSGRQFKSPCKTSPIGSLKCVATGRPGGVRGNVDDLSCQSLGNAWRLKSSVNLPARGWLSEDGKEPGPTEGSSVSPTINASSFRGRSADRRWIRKTGVADKTKQVSVKVRCGRQTIHRFPDSLLWHCSSAKFRSVQALVGWHQESPSSVFRSIRRRRVDPGSGRRHRDLAAEQGSDDCSVPSQVVASGTDRGL